jgi:PAS domain S-box-containing protein
VNYADRVRRILFFTICLALILPLPPFLRGAEDHIRFQHLTVEDGLSQGMVNCILQDKIGFMWFGTNSGLNRYDGFKIRTYFREENNENSLCGNNITCLLEDNGGNIWIGTTSGLSRFDPLREEFKKFYHQPQNENSLSNNSIISLDKGDNGCLWIGTAGGLNCYDPEKMVFNRFSIQSSKKNNSAPTRINAIHVEDAEKIWIGTNRELVLFNPQKGTVQQAGIIVDGQIRAFNRAASHIYQDREGVIWVVGAGRMFNKDQKKGMNFISLGGNKLPQVNVTAIFQDFRGKVWFTTWGWGAFILDKITGEVQNCTVNPYRDDSVSTNHHPCVYADRGGVVWLGTGGYGLDKWTAEYNWFGKYSQNPQSNKGLGFRSVRAIYRDQRGDLWVGGYGGLDRIDVKKDRFTHYRVNKEMKNGLSATNVSSIEGDPIDPLHFMWIGFDSGDLDKFDLKKGVITARYNVRGILQQSTQYDINDIAEDKKGRLWLATPQGLVKFDVKEESFKSIPADKGEVTGNRAVNVQTLKDHGQDRLLLGTLAKGLLRFDKSSESLSNFLIDGRNPLKRQRVLSIYPDDKGNIWAGTAGSGLFCLNPDMKAVTQYTTNVGLPDNVIYGIVEDHFGDFWISTNRGLCRFRPGRNSFRNYPAATGLQSLEFNWGAYYKDREGTIYFGGVNGVNVVHPEIVWDNPFKPQVALTDFQIFNKSVPIGSGAAGEPVLKQAISRTSNLILSYHNNVLSFEFAALHYVSPDKNKYAYKMEGFEQDWNYVSDRRYVTYTALPHGEYIFRVKAANSDGLWDNEGCKLHLRIMPPLWATWWFRILVILLLISIAALFLQIRTASIRRRNIQLQESNIVLNREIAERKKIEKALTESEKNYRTLFVSIPDPILIFHQENHRILDCNQAALDRFGYSRQELGQMTPFDLHAPSDPPTATIVIHQPRQHILLTRDKKQLQVEVHTSEVDYRSEQAYVAIIRDVTLQKQLEQELNQAQKMESIGKLAGGIAHDFNNLLTAMLGHAELALMKMIKDSPLEKDIRAILNSGQRASGLISQLLAFGRKQLIKPIVLNVNELIGDLHSMLRRLIGEDITITAQLKPGLANIKADPVQVEQILINLIINARDAIREHNGAGGAKKITLKTDQVTLDDRFVEGHLEVHSGRYIVISVSDTGIGMDESTKKQIFDPFFTTKGESEGTGLGMSTVYGIVKQNRGSIYVYSEPDRGTTIKIYWPASSEHVKIGKSEPLSAAAVAVFRTVLVVEDDKNVRDFTRAALQELGYDVTACATGIEAMDLVESKGKSFDLLITDLIMPEMNGRELSDKLAARFPQLKIIITSGYPDRHLNQLQDLPTGIQFMAKPYSIQTLVAIINSISD